MDKATKRNGIFKLEPDPVKTKAKEAKASQTADLAAIKSKLTDEALRAILERLLHRLEALENS
ncbi:MAG: hypothetical protein FD147_306 [Chloroflexi bacterium]|nr:MAG: hypothetical protein FD147_306 [Chloroflexota bacterium]MBA4375279.1 hypothetical protein [Anaerolinea sp.]